MKKFKNSLSLNPWFTICFLLFLLLSSSILFIADSAEAFLLLNSYHNYALDVFLNLYTFVGNGLFSIGVWAYLLWKKKFLLAKQVITAFLLSGIIVQIIKHLVFAPRPKLFLSASAYNHFIDGVTLSGNSAFPSGHTASAFALATVLALSAQNVRRSLIYLLAAIIAAYSRLYLGHHFITDIIIGALLGVATSFFVVSYVTPQTFMLPPKFLLRSRQINIYKWLQRLH